MSALAALKQYKQWLLYKLEPKPNGSVNKRTYSLQAGRFVGIHDSEYYMSYDDAAAQVKLLGPEYGLAFVLTENDDIFFVDIDKCKLDDGSWSDIAHEICAMFPGAAIEVSQSGAGLHILATAKNIPKHSCKNSKLGIELYHKDRFVATTEDQISGDSTLDL